VLTTSRAHPLTRRLAGIDYQIVRVANRQAELAATYTIEVSASREHPLVTAKPLLFSSSDAGQTLRQRGGVPPVLRSPVSFAH
jgi:hypothetical protein